VQCSNPASSPFYQVSVLHLIAAVNQRMALAGHGTICQTGDGFSAVWFRASPRGGRPVTNTDEYLMLIVSSRFQRYERDPDWSRTSTAR